MQLIYFLVSSERRGKPCKGIEKIGASRGISVGKMNGLTRNNGKNGQRKRNIKLVAITSKVIREEGQPRLFLKYYAIWM